MIFKAGNDLRQDQFALRMIRVFRRILLDAGLDLEVTPYNVLATSPTWEAGEERERIMYRASGNSLFCVLKPSM